MSFPALINFVLDYSWLVFTTIFFERISFEAQFKIEHLPLFIGDCKALK